MLLDPVSSDIDQLGRAELLSARLTASVIICTYTEERWPLLLRSVASVQDQSRLPTEIIVCVDHNQVLLERCGSMWEGGDTRSSVPIRVTANQHEGHLASARNTAAELADGDILVFLDDDAWADRDWLKYLLAPYESESTMAVGGAPTPAFEEARPRWFPHEFDWVFGCTYAGLPEELAPVSRLIGASMSVRRLALKEIGGFQSDNHDDMDMCHRLAYLRPADQILYEPMAGIHHFVPTERTTWRYFCDRCFTVNRGKVHAFHQMKDAANLSADIRFVSRALSQGVALAVRETLQGDLWSMARALAILAGIGLAGSGHAVGQLERRLLPGWRR